MNTERSSLLLKRPMYSCEENMHEHITYVHLCIYVHTICVHPEPVSLGTGCSVNIVFFSLKYCDFLNSASSAAALVFYLPFSGPGTQRWKTERGQSPEYILKFSKKKTIFN